MKEESSLEDIQNEILNYIEKCCDGKHPNKMGKVPSLQDMVSRARELEQAIDDVSKLEIFENSGIAGVLSNPLFQSNITVLYQEIQEATEMIADIKKIGIKRANESDMLSNTCSVIVNIQSRNFIYLISLSDEIRLELARGFLSHLKSLYARNKGDLELIGTNPLATQILEIIRSKPVELLKTETNSYAKYRSMRASEFKLLKLWCAYPIMTTLRLKGEKHRDIHRLIHNLLVLGRAPNYGRSYYESKSGEKEELKRIEKWEEESIKWYDTL